MKKTIRPIALVLAAIFALSALACSGGGGSETTQPQTTPHKEAMMPPITWKSLGDASMIKLTVNGNTKSYTATELYALDHGQIVGYDNKTEALRDGDPMYFCGVYMKGLMFSADQTLDFNAIRFLKLIGVDGAETVLDGELASSVLLESVLALQRGAIVTDAENGCMLVLKNTNGRDQQNKIYKGIAEIVVGG